MATAELRKPRTSDRKLEAKQAATLALEYFKELFPNATGSNVTLEEVELLEDENCWLITLGFDEPPRTRTSAAEISPINKSFADIFGKSSPTKRFKVFKVDARTGKVISMKNPQARLA